MTPSASRMLARVSASAFTVFLSACGGPSDVTGPELTSSEVAIIDLRWTVTPGNQDPFAYEPQEIGGVALSTDLALVYATSRTGVLEAYGLVDGALVWTAALDEEPYSAPVVDGLDLFVGLSDGRIVCFDARNGQQKWTYVASSAVHTRVAFNDTLVAAVAADNSLHVLRRSDGSPIARHAQNRPTDLTMLGAAEVLFTETDLFAGFGDGRLGRFDHGGQLLWLANLSGEQRRLVDVDSRPLVVGNLVIASSYTGGVHAVRAGDGSIAWSVDQRGARSAILTPDGTLMSVSSNGLILWIAPDTGQVLDSLELDSDSLSEPVQVTPDMVAVASRGQGMYLLSTRRPWVFGRFESGSGFSSSPVSQQAQIAILSDRGSLYMLDVATRPLR
jgi:outer membrane protein assembly factor BamB